MSEQKAKELADRLRVCALAPYPQSLLDQSAAELDRLADLCAKQAKELADSQLHCEQYREWYYKASDDRAMLGHELDQAKAQVSAQAKRIAECGRMNSDLYENHKRLDKELATLREDRDALAEGVRLFREQSENVGHDGAAAVREKVRAWERKHGHRADKKPSDGQVLVSNGANGAQWKEPARKSDEVKPQTVVITNNTNVPVNATLTFQVSDPLPVTVKVVKVEEKPPLLDLRTLPVGTVCEAVGELDTIIRAHKVVGQFTITEHDTSAETDWTTRVRSESSELPVAWVKALQSARVITKPEPKPTPAPEPFRALPALALRRAHKEWDNDNGSRLVFDTAAETWRYDRVRPHGATWAEVELKAARMLGSENKIGGWCICCKPECGSQIWLRSELGITDSTRDMTALWAAFREGQQS